MRSHRVLVVTAMTAILGSSMIARAADLTGNISVGTQASNFNLTTMNGEVNSVIDWVVWGQGTSTSLSPTNSQNGGTAISDLTLHNPDSQPLRGLGQFSLGQTYQWSNGSPTASASNINTGIQVDPFEPTTPNELLGTGFSFTVAGSTTQTRRLYVWVGQHSGTSTFTASLTGATSTSHQLTAGQDASSYALLTYDFKPNSVSDVLTIQGLVTAVTPGGNGTTYTNNYWFAAAVGVVIVPEPSTYVLGTIATGVFGWVSRKRKNRRAIA